MRPSVACRSEAARAKPITPAIEARIAQRQVAIRDEPAHERKAVQTIADASTADGSAPPNRSRDTLYRYAPQ